MGDGQYMLKQPFFVFEEQSFGGPTYPPHRVVRVARGHYLQRLVAGAPDERHVARGEHLLVCVVGLISI